jgi:glycosyltransferase involved in cell wall biosynthesis
VVNAGYVEDGELPRYYAMADLFVFPSLLEGFGLPIAEALACGTPVVTTEAGSSPEVAGPGGLVVPPRASLELAAAITTLRDDAGLRRTLALQGERWVRERFDRGRMVRETLAAYQAA